MEAKRRKRSSAEKPYEELAMEFKRLQEGDTDMLFKEGDKDMHKEQNHEDEETNMANDEATREGVQQEHSITSQDQNLQNASEEGSFDRKHLANAIQKGKEFDRMVDRLHLHDLISVNTGLVNRFPEGPFFTACSRRSRKAKKFEVLNGDGTLGHIRSMSMFLIQRTQAMFSMLETIKVPPSWVTHSNVSQYDSSSQNTSSSSDDRMSKHITIVVPQGVYPFFGPSGIGKGMLAFEMMVRIKKTRHDVKVIYVDKGKRYVMQMSIRSACYTLTEEIVRCFPDLSRECLDVLSSNTEEDSVNALMILFARVGSVCAQDGLHVMLLIDGYHHNYKFLEPLRIRISQAWSYYPNCTRIVLVGSAINDMPYLHCMQKDLVKHMLWNADIVAKYVDSCMNKMCISTEELEDVMHATCGVAHEVSLFIGELEEHGMAQKAIESLTQRRKKDICNEQVQFWSTLNDFDAKRYMKSIIAMQYGFSTHALSSGFLDHRFMYKMENDTFVSSTHIAKEVVLSVAYERMASKYCGLLHEIADYIFRHPHMFTNAVIGKFVELLIHNHVMQGNVLVLNDIYSIKRRGKPVKLNYTWGFFGLNCVEFSGIVPPRTRCWDSSAKRLFFHPLTSNYPDADCLVFCDPAAATSTFPRGVTAFQITVTTPLTSHSNRFFEVSARDNGVHASKWKDLLQCEEKDVRMLFLTKQVPNAAPEEWLAHDKTWSSPPDYYVVTFQDMAKANPSLQLLNLLYMQV